MRRVGRSALRRARVGKRQLLRTRRTLAARYSSGFARQDGAANGVAAALSVRVPDRLGIGAEVGGRAALRLRGRVRAARESLTREAPPAFFRSGAVVVPRPFGAAQRRLQRARRNTPRRP